MGLEDQQYIALLSFIRFPPYGVQAMKLKILPSPGQDGSVFHTYPEDARMIQEIHYAKKSEETPEKDIKLHSHRRDPPTVKASRPEAGPVTPRSKSKC